MNEKIIIDGIEFSEKSLLGSHWWNFGKYNVHLDDFYKGLLCYMKSLKNNDFTKNKIKKYKRLGVEKYMILEDIHGIRHSFELKEDTKVELVNIQNLGYYNLIKSLPQKSILIVGYDKELSSRYGYSLTDYIDTLNTEDGVSKYTWSTIPKDKLYEVVIFEHLPSSSYGDALASIKNHIRKDSVLYVKGFSVECALSMICFPRDYMLDFFTYTDLQTLLGHL